MPLARPVRLMNKSYGPSFVRASTDRAENWACVLAGRTAPPLSAFWRIMNAEIIATGSELVLGEPWTSGLRRCNDVALFIRLVLPADARKLVTNDAASHCTTHGYVAALSLGAQHNGNPADRLPSDTAVQRFPGVLLGRR